MCYAEFGEDEVGPFDFQSIRTEKQEVVRYVVGRD